MVGPAAQQGVQLGLLRVGQPAVAEGHAEHVKAGELARVPAQLRTACPADLKASHIRFPQGTHAWGALEGRRVVELDVNVQPAPEHLSRPRPRVTQTRPAVDHS